MPLTSLSDHNTKKIPRNPDKGNGLACPSCKGELIDDPDQKFVKAGKPPTRTVLCQKCPKPAEPLKRLVSLASDLTIEENLLTDALAKAEAEAHEEMVTSKEKWVTERDPTGWVGYATEVYNKFFESFPAVADYMDGLREQINTQAFVMGPTYRRRVMFRVLTERRSFIADAERRAVNSPIQCVSSESGITAGIIITRAAHRYLLDMGMDVDHYMSMYCRAVHDANYFEERYAMCLPALHIHNHCATVAVSDFYEQEFGFRPNLNAEIEIDFGANDAESESWNCVIADLPPIFLKSIKDRVKYGYLDPKHEAAAFRATMQPWISKKHRHYLQKNFPLLQVTDLEDIICDAVEKAGFKPER